MRSQIWLINRKFPGQIAVIARPRGGDLLRDEARSWENSGLNVIVSLLTDEEARELDIRQEAEVCLAANLEFVNFPIVDRSVPAMDERFFVFVERPAKMLVGGKNIGVHCRQSIGRAALIAAALMIMLGVDSSTALQ